MYTRVAVGLSVSVLVGSTLLLSAADAPRLAATSSSQRIQNARADVEDLSRMADDGMVRRFQRAGLLIAVPAATSSFYLQQVPARSRFLRPWAKLFLTRISQQFHARFGTRLRITGLVRTVAYQRALGARNHNAAAATGPLQSTHLTGATLDVSKRFMTPAHVQWMRQVLFGLREREVLYALEEFSQPCFHVMVYRSYADYVNGQS
jgi:hypothetical protein